MPCIIMMLITHVTPNTSLHNSCVQSCTYLLHVSALLSHHRQLPEDGEKIASIHVGAIWKTVCINCGVMYLLVLHELFTAHLWLKCVIVPLTEHVLVGVNVDIQVVLVFLLLLLCGHLQTVSAHFKHTTLVSPQSCGNSTVVV
jgi:hypothetical protein